MRISIRHGHLSSIIAFLQVPAPEIGGPPVGTPIFRKNLIFGHGHWGPSNRRLWPTSFRLSFCSLSMLLWDLHFAKFGSRFWPLGAQLRKFVLPQLRPRRFRHLRAELGRQLQPMELRSCVILDKSPPAFQPQHSPEFRTHPFNEVPAPAARSPPSQTPQSRLATSEFV